MSENPRSIGPCARRPRGAKLPLRQAARTDAAGHKAGTLFTEDALQRIFEYAKGIPRRINQVCTTALMAGLIDQKSVLDESTIRKAIADIDHD